MTTRREPTTHRANGRSQAGRRNVYEGKRPLDSVRRVAVIAYHSSPLMEPGSNDAGGMMVYVRELAAAHARLGVHTDVFTRATGAEPRVSRLGQGVRVVAIEAGPRLALPKDRLPEHIMEFVDGVRAFALSRSSDYDVVLQLLAIGARRHLVGARLGHPARALSAHAGSG